MAKVSVIIPVYNVQKYLAECLDSVINQTFDDIEIICVNDGSTDNSLNILEHYAKIEPRMKIITQENGGLSAARNTGFEHATGKYTLFIDSDDFISNIAVEKLYNCAEKNSCDMVIYDFFRNHSDLRLRCGLTILELDSSYCDKVFNIETLDGDFYKLIPVTAWSKLYRTDFLRENNISFIPGLIYEDVPYYAKVYSHAKRISYVKIPMYSYHMGYPEQITSNNNRVMFDVIKIYKLSEETLRETGHYERVKHAFHLLLMRDYAMKLKLISQELKPELFNAFKSYMPEVDYEYYEKHATPDEKVTIRLYKLMSENEDYQTFSKLANVEGL